MSAGAARARDFVRPARGSDLAALAAIERAAGALFAEAGMQGAFLAETTPAATLRASLAGGLLWVATDADDRPVGFALASVLDSGPHLEELDVHPDFGRRGLGAALVAAVLDWSRAAGYGGLTLVTFRDVPWNGPFYERLGFRPLAADDLGADLHEHLENEAARGLPSERRVVLRYTGSPA